MKKREYRFFKEGCPHHVYIRSVAGNIIFYSAEDFVYFLTLLYCLSIKYGIEILSVCLMPNHIHLCEYASDEDTFTRFNNALIGTFAKEYNKRHGRKGPLFQSPFGYAPKSVVKRVRDVLCYIPNNPVVGHLVNDPLGYRWNLLAYRDSDHPFSKKIGSRNVRYSLSRAVELLKSFWERGEPISYAKQSLLYKKLNGVEKGQLIDKIISLYNCVNYSKMASFFNGTIDEVLSVLSSNGGSEYDLLDDYEDYSVYRKMVAICSGIGLDMTSINFDAIDDGVRRELDMRFCREGFSKWQISKFLGAKND